MKETSFFRKASKSTCTNKNSSRTINGAWTGLMVDDHSFRAVVFTLVTAPLSEFVKQLQGDCKALLEFGFGADIAYMSNQSIANAPIALNCLCKFDKRILHVFNMQQLI